MVPQVNPFSFLLYTEETVAPGVLEMRYARCDLLRNSLELRGSVRGFVDGSSSHPVQTAAEAVGASYRTALTKSWFLGETDRFAKSRATENGFEVYWYSLELNLWGRAAGVLANIDSSTGTITARSAWRNPDRFGN